MTVATEFPIADVRAEFPSLQLTDNDVTRTYLDNPAGTQVPRRVAEAAARCLIESNANVGGFFRTSVLAEEVVDRTRHAMALFLGAKSTREIIIGPSMTSLTFQLSRSIANRFSAGDEIVLTRMDHDANVAPWLAIAEERGLSVRWLSFDREMWRLEPAALEGVLSERTRLVAFPYASNLLGSINDVRELVKKARSVGALTYVDAVQFAPHGLIDVEDIGADFLACSAYKFYGPHLGIVWAREAVLEELKPYKVRPSKNALPWRFENGTPQIELFAGLEAGLDYFDWLGRSVCSYVQPRDRLRAAFAAASAWEEELTKMLIAGLQSIPGVSIVGITDPSQSTWRVGTVSFVSGANAPSEIARRLAEENVFVWSGYNYALETIRNLGISDASGVVRIGIAHYNTPEEIERTIRAVSRFT